MRLFHLNRFILSDGNEKSQVDLGDKNVERLEAKDVKKLNLLKYSLIILMKFSIKITQEETKSNSDYDARFVFEKVLAL